MRASIAFLAVVAALAVPASALAAPATCGKLLSSSNGVYFGSAPGFFDESVVDGRKIWAFDSLAGRHAVWVYFSQLWFEGLDFPRGYVRTIWRHDEIPFIRFFPLSQLVYPTSFEETRFSMQHILEGQFDAQLRAWADAARDTNIPILLEFGTEINNAFPWNGFFNGGGRLDGYGDPTYPDGPERFRDAFRHLVTLFRGEGATNVTWFFHADTAFSDEPYSAPYVAGEPRWNKLAYYYPGDDYVDWIGLSDYGLPTWPDGRIIGFEEKLALFHAPDYPGAYADLTGLSARPLAMLEVGVGEHPGGVKPRWIRDAFSVIRSGKYPRIAAVSWVMASDPPFDTEPQTSPESLQAFREAVADPFFGAQPQVSGDCAPATPTPVHASTGLRSGVTVGWRPVPSAAHYRVRRSGKIVGTTDETTFLDTKAVRGRRYGYAVQAVNMLGASAFSRTAVGARR